MFEQICVTKNLRWNRLSSTFDRRVIDPRLKTVYLFDNLNEFISNLFESLVDSGD